MTELVLSVLWNKPIISLENWPAIPNFGISLQDPTPKAQTQTKKIEKKMVKKKMVKKKEVTVMITWTKNKAKVQKKKIEIINPLSNLLTLKRCKIFQRNLYNSTLS